MKREGQALGRAGWLRTQLAAVASAVGSIGLAVLYVSLLHSCAETRANQQPVAHASRSPISPHSSDEDAGALAESEAEAAATDADAGPHELEEPRSCAATWCLFLRLGVGADSKPKAGMTGDLTIGARVLWVDFGAYVASERYRLREPMMDSRQLHAGISIGLEMAALVPFSEHWRTGPLVRVGRLAFCEKDCDSMYDGYAFGARWALGWQNAPRAGYPSFFIGGFAGVAAILISSHTTPAGTATFNRANTGFTLGLLFELNYNVPRLQAHTRGESQSAR
jgi:hypothetical protein